MTGQMDEVNKTATIAEAAADIERLLVTDEVKQAIVAHGLTVEQIISEQYPIEQSDFVMSVAMEWSKKARVLLAEMLGPLASVIAEAESSPANDLAATAPDLDSMTPEQLVAEGERLDRLMALENRKGAILVLLHLDTIRTHAEMQEILAQYKDDKDGFIREIEAAGDRMQERNRPLIDELVKIVQEERQNAPQA